RVDFVRHCDRSRRCAGPPRAPRAIRTASSDRACKRLTVHSIASGASAMLRTVLPVIAALCVACLCCGSAATAAEFAEEPIEVSNTERRYLVHDFSGGQKTALVLVHPGGGGNGRNAADQTRFDRVAERERLIAVYPYGSGGLRRDALL